MGEETMDFLKDVVASAPDLAPEDEEAAAKPKRRRYEGYNKAVHDRGFVG